MSSQGMLSEEISGGSVRLESLRKEFDEVIAVDGIDLEINPGEFLTMLGPSGCGKSTTLRMIAGLETPTSGNVLINDADLTDVPANKRNTAMVFQEWALFPHMTVGENISFGLEMDGVPKDERTRRVAEALELVELSGYEDRRATQLSGGQKQRVAMARAIVREPDVLLLDEPLASLDRSLRQRMQIELKRIQEDLGITFIYVTHDQEEALTMSDRIAVMNDGHLEQVGEVTELYERPKTKFVATFLGETNLFEGTAVVDGDARYADIDGLRVQIQTDRDVAEGDPIVITLRPEEVFIGSGDLDYDNVFTGTVEDAVYKGSFTIYEVDVEGHTVTAEQQRRSSLSTFERGDEVALGFSSHAAEVVPE